MRSDTHLVKISLEVGQRDLVGQVEQTEAKQLDKHLQVGQVSSRSPIQAQAPVEAGKHLPVVRTYPSVASKNSCFQVQL